MFTEEEVKRLKQCYLDNADILYLERRIDNAKTENEAKFWQEIFRCAISNNPEDGDNCILYRDDVCWFQMFAYCSFTLDVMDRDGVWEKRDYRIEQTMTDERDFNGITTTLEKYLDDEVHWDYKAEWEWY